MGIGRYLDILKQRVIGRRPHEAGRAAGHAPDFRGGLDLQPFLDAVARDAGFGAGGRVGKLMGEALSALQAQNPGRAFDLLVEAKATRCPTRGLDEFRGLCFLSLGRIEEARGALLEELRLHPDNVRARRFLDAVMEKAPFRRGAAVEGEFREILGVVRPHTMLSDERLHSLYAHAREICLDDVPGNFAECGVAGGGASALLAAVIRRHSRRPRLLFACDTFEGMPPPTAHDRHGAEGADATGWGAGTCAAPESGVIEVCRMLDAAEPVRTVKGLFRETLPAARVRMGALALLHMDADWYESTLEILENLYDNVNGGGFIQVDDYGHWEGCRKALHEFEALRGVAFRLNRIDGTGVWFAKPPEGAPGAS